MAALQQGEAAARRTLPAVATPALHPSSHRAARRGRETNTSVPLVPGSMSSKLERASGWRSSDFGVKIISWREEEGDKHGGQPRQKHLPCKPRPERRPARPAHPSPARAQEQPQEMCSSCSARPGTAFRQHQLSQSGFPLGNRLRCCWGPACPAAGAGGKRLHRVIYRCPPAPTPLTSPQCAGGGCSHPSLHEPAGSTARTEPTPSTKRSLAGAEANCPCLLLRCKNKPAPSPVPRLSRDAGLPCLGTELGTELPALTGLRKGRRIWRRRTWKKLAGVEQFTTIQLQS